MSRPNLPDPERPRRVVGTVLYALGLLLGGLLFTLVFLVPPLFERDPLALYGNMLSAAALAFPAVLVYMTVPRLLDRYDPEPAWALAMVFVWGAVAACGVSGVINTVVGEIFGEAVSAVLSAPLVEEFMKGLAVAGMFYFWRREFDGVVDGIIYATFVALGFAAVENVIYYARAARQGETALTGLFILRGVITPWAHPLFTAMTGIGFGVSRETATGVLRWMAPFLGYAAAVFLHFVWNGSAVFSAAVHVPIVLILLPLWFLFVAAFLGMVIVLVRRRGRIIRANLQDEVLLGTVTPEEFELVGSAFGIFKAAMGPGGAIRAQIIRACARLALSKWHAERAWRAQRRTVSYDFILPLREEIRNLRARLQSPHPAPYGHVPQHVQAPYTSHSPQLPYPPQPPHGPPRW
jgi:RsiW-degrading membrane proteinase PrsW (M82 family)